MQGKGLVKFFTIVLLLVVAYQFLLMWPTSRVESDAKTYAEEHTAHITDENVRKFKAEELNQYYLDSVSTEPVFNLLWMKEYNYQELKRQQLAYGLDLQGGMSVVLQVDLEDLIKALSGQSTDNVFKQALIEAKKSQKNSQSDFVTLFVAEFEKLSKTKKLATIFTASDKLSKHGVTVTSTNAEVLTAMRAEASETVDRTYKLLKQRIDRFGVAQPVVSLDKSTDRITVELPGVRNPKRARDLLQATANLEFWDIHRNVDVLKYVDKLNTVLKTKAALATKSKNTEDSTNTPKIPQNDSLNSDDIPTPDSVGGDIPTPDSVGGDIPTPDSIGSTTTDSTTQLDPNPIAETADTNSSDYGPVFNVLSPIQSEETAIIGIARGRDTAIVDSLFRTAEAKKIIPKHAKFLWGAKFQKNEDTGERLFYLYCINTKNKKEAPLQGSRITEAYPTANSSGAGYAVMLDMDNEGARIWKDMTTRNVGREVAVVLDNKVYSAPRVNDVISGGGTEISGDFSVEEATDLATILSIGKLPTKTNIIEEAIVGPSLGAETVNAGLLALVIGLLLVLLFMLGYYSFAGFISIICLLLNVFFIIGSLASFGTVLTLPGIAGIVLTIGMAVDANVIIYERIREELREHEDWVLAIKNGFAHSYSAIIDANITSLVVAFILFKYGLGPIKGFATVLMIGVFCSVFSAVFIGRMLFNYWTEKGRRITVWTNATKNFLAKPGIDFVSKRKIAYAVSSLILIAGIASMFTRSFELGVDLQGGRSYTVEFPEDIADVTALKNGIIASFEGYEQSIDKKYGANGTNVKTFNNNNQVKITTSFMQGADMEGIDGIVLNLMYEGCKKYAGVDIDLKTFEKGRPADNQEAGMYLSASAKVGPTIADDIQQSAYWASILALLFIFTYILVRFRKWQFSAGALAALVHDVLFVLSIFSIFHGILPFSLEIDQAFVAALLTVIGYSINDTVVVFDRIRETATNMPDQPLKKIVNIAVNNTLSRTFITSLTTFFVVAILFAFGGDGIRGFAFALMIGVMVGTYSSVFIATPIVVDATRDASDIKYDVPEPVVEEGPETEATEEPEPEEKA